MSADARRRPEVATRHVLATTTGTLYSAGGVAVLLAALTDPHHSAVLFALAATAITTGVAVLRRGAGLPLWFIHVLVASGSGLIATAVLTAPSLVTACVLASLYGFVAIDVCYYFARRAALAQLALLLSAAASSLVLRGVPWGVTGAMLVVLVATAVVIGDLAHRASKASKDPLTGLLNRRGTDDALDDAMTEASRSHDCLGVALLDVDRFKAVNDVQGHASGDALLRAIASDLRRALPPTAIIGRPGGDEFMVLLPGVDDEAALVVLQEAHRRVRHPLSVGVVGHLDGEGAGDVLHRADAALYEAKQGGRNRVVLGTAGSSHLARDLAAALNTPEGSGLHVVLQPVVRVGSQHVVAVEALLRWEHPTRGAISPLDVVSMAEAAGLAPRLGAFVLSRACTEAAGLQQRWGDDLVLTVNACGAELAAPGYAEGVLNLLGEAGWPAQRLVIEVTETVVDAGSADVIACLHRLRSAGVRIAIDDFGAGYSTFARLNEVPADFLKLDRALLEAATTSPRRRALLEAVLGVSSTLGLVAVAEGVETSEQADLLAALGCSLAQGFLYARPASASDLLKTASPSGVPEERREPVGQPVPAAVVPFPRPSGDGGQPTHVGESASQA